MRKSVILVFIIICNSTFAQNCNIGNQDSTFFNSSPPSGVIVFAENYLLGGKFNLNTNGILVSLNLLGKNTGASVQMAVYDDISGAPGNLLVSSNPSIVGSGIISLPVTPTQLIPGDYWIMAIYDTNGFHTFYTDTAASNNIYYTALNFGDAIPPNGSSFLSYNNGQNFTYFMEINCGTLGISNIENLHNINFYPNPSSGIFTFTHSNTNSTEIEITNIVGELIYKTELTYQQTAIDLSRQPKGIYFVRTTDNSRHITSKKIIIQ
jgi:hypothetical protein